MNLLLIGGGGREHAILRALKKNPEVETVYALPGNGGMQGDAVCVPISATDLPAIEAFVKEHPVDYAVVAPDDPLVLGCVDMLNALGIPCFGPDKKAAILEGSKVFSKDLMKKYHIPTALYETFTELPKALAYVEDHPLPLVVKADGLARGKGVFICETVEEAKEALKDLLEDGKLGGAGKSGVVVEEFLDGPEVSVLTLTDGKTLKPLCSSMDHKRALDNDQGGNTGGMGAIAPNPYYTQEIADRCMKEIYMPTIEAMQDLGRPFKGCLYFGLILTKNGPKVLEYNCRFGDPETQVVLPLLESDLFTLMKATTEGTLDQHEVRFSNQYACCVVTASQGYPGYYDIGFPITMSEEALKHSYFAGVQKRQGQLYTSGGRVVATTALAPSLKDAISEAYRLAGELDFQNAYRRKDIGARALQAEKKPL